MNTWIAILKSEITSNLLFKNRGGNGEVVASAISSDEKKAIMESFLLQDCDVHTISQGCADWLLLPQFIVTGTSAGRLLLLDYSTSSMLGINAAQEI